MPVKFNIKWFINTIFNSYSQVFFSENKLFGILLLVISFFDLEAGFYGLLSVITANFTAYILGFDRISLTEGLYGYNALLVGLGIGYLFDPGFVLTAIVIFGALLTLFITVSFQSILLGYGLPFLSLPFLLALWFILLATKDFNSIEFSEKSIYVYNELYAVGGKNLVDFYIWIQNFPIWQPVKIYLLSLAAIFFQTNVIAGLLIAFGLLYYSRIAFTLSVTGFAVVYLFYYFIGADFSALSYTFIGFNYILTSIAVGGIFVIASFRSFFWTVLLLPLTVIFTAGLMHIFRVWNLPVYALPFNLTVLLFIYVLKQRRIRHGKLIDSFVKQATPEQSLYLHHIITEELKNKNYFPIHLPVKGNWYINQGHNGAYTHKDKWQHAWDFVIVDEDRKQFSGTGDLLTDYYDWDKPVFAPASGIVAEIKDGIPDNIIGDINTAHNWGNTIVIKHTESLYSQLSHLKEGSIMVQKGDFVRKGQRIGKIGNSGHSPYPHLHFQLQATPYIGSETLEYPLHNYIVNTSQNPVLVNFGIPVEKEVVAPAHVDVILSNALHLIPGKKLSVTNENGRQSIWNVYKDIWNQTYIVDRKHKVSAYFFENESGLFQTNYYGNRQADLFIFFSALYNVNKAFYKHTKVTGSIRPDLFFNKSLTLLQDFAAPFYVFLKTEFSLTYVDKDDEYLADTVYLKSQITGKVFGRYKRQMDFDITIHKSGDMEIKMKQTGKKLKIKPE